MSLHRSSPSFDDDGFVVFPRFIVGDDLSDLIANVDRFIAEVVPQLPPQHVFYESKNDPGSLKQIQQMGDYDRWFHQLFTGSRFREVAESLLDGVG